MIKLKKLPSNHRKYNSGMRYSVSTANGNIYFSELGLLELKDKILTVVQQSLSGSGKPSIQICKDFEEGEKCTKGLNSTCGKCGYLSDADF